MRTGIGYPSYGANSNAPVLYTRSNYTRSNNTNPTVTTNISKNGDAASVLSVVDDTTELTLAGLINIATSGKVYKLDNTAGTTSAFASCSSVALPATRPISLSAWVRGSGTGYIRSTTVTNPVTTSAFPAHYSRITLSGTPTGTGESLQIRCNPGAVVYFILHQIEVFPFPTAPISTVVTTTVTAFTDTVDANYPLANLNDMINLRRVGLWTSTAGAYFNMQISSQAQTLGIVALVHHNAPAGATWRVNGFSGTSGADPDLNSAHLLYDSGEVSFPTPVAGYSQVTPFIIPTPTSTRSVWIGLSDRRYIDNQPWQIGAVELAGIWLWPDVDLGRQRGFTSRGQRIQQPGGVDATLDQWSPRIYSGSRELVDRSELDTTVADFQMAYGKSQPFVAVGDIDDSTTWARECMVARNKEVMVSTATADPGGRMPFSLEEYLA